MVPGLEQLEGRSILIAGATGLIGSFLTDMLLEYNSSREGNMKIYLVSRNMAHLHKRFDAAGAACLHYLEHDVSEPLPFDFGVDYLFHAASNAYPASFNQDPVGTILGNVLGTKYWETKNIV